MSEIYECEHAQHLFGKFIRELSACQVKWVGLYDFDSPVEPSIDVDRKDATNCFLRKNPSCERFRDDLARVHCPANMFTFKTALWNHLLENEFEGVSPPQ